MEILCIIAYLGNQGPESFGCKIEIPLDTYLFIGHVSLYNKFRIEKWSLNDLNDVQISF